VAAPLLLHITTPAAWRVALAAGTYVAPSRFVPGGEGFIHLSTPAQVHHPANLLYRGRDDLLLLVLDEARLDGEVVFEPGAHGEAELFPHLYGTIPTGAVTSVVPWPPGPDGLFTPPTGLPAPDDLTARALAFEPSLARRRAAAVIPFDEGFATLDPRVPASYEHNGLWFTEPAASAAEVREVADHLLAELPHRRVVTDHPLPPDLGWEVDEQRIMVLAPEAAAPDPVADVTVEAVTSEVMDGLWGPSWRASIPGIDDDAVADLLRREPFADAHVRIVDLAVRGDDGVPVAGAQLRIDGATAAVEAVMTVPERRRERLGHALVGEAIRRSRAAGCDLVWLLAFADDWPREWYARLCFAEVATRWVATTTDL
jgi:uncharacterized protein (DUF952 family)/GNAT superfamily N-acetyltransferase